MKQQVNPVMAAVIAVAVLAVLGIVIFVLNNRPAPPPPPSTPAETATKNMSPSDVVKSHMQQMQQGGGSR